MQGRTDSHRTRPGASVFAFVSLFPASSPWLFLRSPCTSISPAGVPIALCLLCVLLGHLPKFPWLSLLTRCNKRYLKSPSPWQLSSAFFFPSWWHRLLEPPHLCTSLTHFLGLFAAADTFVNVSCEYKALFFLLTSYCIYQLPLGQTVSLFTLRRSCVKMKTDATQRGPPTRAGWWLQVGSKTHSILFTLHSQSLARTWYVRGAS